MKPIGLPHRAGANAIFRKLGVTSPWGYTNDLMTCGRGSPFLSKDVSTLLKSIRRREVRSASFVRRPNCPIFSSDYVLFAGKVEKVLLAVYEDTVNKLDWEWSDGSGAGATEEDNDDSCMMLRDVLQEMCKVVVMPLLFQAVPEFTRASSHRGEVYDAKHFEMFPSNVRGCARAPRPRCDPIPIGLLIPIGLITPIGLISHRSVTCANRSVLATGSPHGRTSRHQARTRGNDVGGSLATRALWVRPFLL